MSLPVTENFTGSDGTSPPNSNWTNFTSKGIAIKTNTAVSVTNGSYGFAFWKASVDAAPNDQEASCTILSGGVGGPIVRATDENCYWLDCNDSGASNSYIWKRIAGSNTILQTLNTTFNAGDKAKLKIVGNTLQAFKDTGSGFVQIGTDQASGGELTSGQFGVNSLQGAAVSVDDFIGDAAGGSASSSLPGRPVVVGQAVNRASVF